MTYNKLLLTQKFTSNYFFKAGFKALYLIEYHIFHFGLPQLSVTSSATLKDTNTIEEFSQTIRIYIWFPPTIFSLTMSSNPGQHYFTLVCQDSLGLSKCFMTAWIKNHQRPIWDSQGYLQFRPLLTNTRGWLLLHLPAWKHYYRRLTYCFLLISLVLFGFKK